MVEIPIAAAVEAEEISVTPEKKTPKRSGKPPSVDSPTKENPPSKAINNEHIVLDPSNNVGASTFVSKSSEEEKNIEKLAEETHLPSIGSSSAKSESIVKEIPPSDEQQRLNQAETNTVVDSTTDEKK